MDFKKLLENNKAWANLRVKEDPEFFRRLENLQKPEFLWIGCSDSRVPANQITDTQPGEIFVHRNIANVVVHTDVNLSAVLDYAVSILKVKHVIVCGHYGCGGVKAAMTHVDFKPILNKWLRNIKDVYRLYQEELDAIADEDARADRLVELNVKEQVMNLAKMSTIQRAWNNDDRPHLHGWAYGLKDGYINPILHLPPKSPIDPLYKYEDL
jgi:carbonic anhydrase